MAVVKQVRVLWNSMSLGLLCLLVLGLVRHHVWEHGVAIGLGVLLGVGMGWGWWQHLSRTIARRGRRYEANKIFVHYLSMVEIAITAVAYHPYLAIPLGVAFLAVLVLTHFSSHWWIVLLGSSGVAGCSVLAGYIIRYEHQYGPLYYQYDNTSWSGAEGLVYQRGTVVQTLAPTGKVKIQGVLWNAVSLSGETISLGEQIEVISLQGLTLYVDRLSPAAEPGNVA